MAIKTRNVLFKFDAEIAGSQAKLDKLAKELEEVDKQYKDAKEGSLEWAEAQRKLIGIQKQLGQATDESSKKTSAWTNTLRGAGKAILAFGGIATLGALVSDATGKIIDFDQALADLSAITGATGGDLEFLENRAKEFGRTTTVSATEALEAFKLVGSAKPELLSNAEALADLTAEAITLSEAAGFDLPTSAANLGNALNSLNLPADESGRVINVLAAAAQQGAREIPFVTDAFTKFGGVASQAGVSIETSAAAVEILGKKIPEAAVVGTNLRGVLIKLQVAAAEQGREFEGLTAELDRLGGSVSDVVRLKEIFGEENLLAAQTLIAERQALVELEEGITGTNAAYEQAETRTSTLRASLTRLRNAWEGIVLRFNAGSGAASKAIRFLADNLETIVKVVASVVAGLVTYRLTILSITAAQNVARIATAAYTAVQGLFTGATQGATVATKAFNTAIKANPIGLLIGVLTTVVALLWDYGDASEEATEKQRKLNEAIKEGQNLIANAESLEKQAAAVRTFNKQQTEAFLERIDQEIAAAEAKGAKLLTLEQETNKKIAQAIGGDEGARLQEINDEIAAALSDGVSRYSESLDLLFLERFRILEDNELAIAQAGLAEISIAQETQEGINQLELDKARQRLNNFKAAGEERLQFLIKQEKLEEDLTKDKDGEAAIPGSIQALQEEVAVLRDKVVKETEIGSEEFAAAIEEYIAASARLDEAQENLRKVEPVQEGSLRALSNTVNELKKQVENTNAEADNFDELVGKLQAAQAELKALQDTIRGSQGGASDQKLAEADLNEAQRNQVALAQIYEEGEIRILDIKIAFAKARLEILKESGKLESDEYQRQLNALEELEAQKSVAVQKSNEEQAASDQAKKDIILDGIQEVLDAAIFAANSMIQIKLDEVQQLINLQQQRVQEAQEIADQGNAEVLEAEEERLNQLNKQREEFVRKQQALAAVQLIAESALAIAKAAAAGGPAAPFTIAATIIALAAGLAQARALASQAAFYEGGYTGDGNPRDASLALGPKPYTYHKGEYVMDHVVTGIGKNREIFDWILGGRVDLAEAFNQRNVIIAQSGGISEAKMDELIAVVKNKPVSSLSLDKRGVVKIVTDAAKKSNRIKSRTS